MAKFIFTLLYRGFYISAGIVFAVMALGFAVVCYEATSLEGWWNELVVEIYPGTKLYAILFLAGYYTKWEMVHGPQRKAE